MALRAFTFLAAIFLVSATNLRAELIIDQFDSPSDGQSVRVTQKSPDDMDTSLANTAIGGYRDLLLHRVAGQPISVDIYSDPGAGMYFTQGTGQGIATVTWDGEYSFYSTSYKLTANLTEHGEDEFVLTVDAFDGTGINVSMTLYTGDGNHSSATLPKLITAAGDVVIPFDDFTIAGPGGAATLSNVNAIELKLDGTGHPGSDLAITKLKTTVPEPSTFVLFAVGTVALVGMGRKWRKA